MERKIAVKVEDRITDTVLVNQEVREGLRKLFNVYARCDTEMETSGSSKNRFGQGFFINTLLYARDKVVIQKS